MSEQFWLGFWKVVGVLLAVLVMTAAGCQSYKTKVTADAVKTSTNPIAASCALNTIPGGTAAGGDIICLKALEK